MTKETCVLLADDHQLVRAGLRSLLEKIPLVDRIVEAGDGQEAIEKIREHRPDIAFIDVSMPRLNGLEAAARIHKEFPNTKVIILSMHANEEYVIEAFRHKASGYLIKNAAGDELARAIRVVMKGEVYFSPQISRRAIEKYLAHSARGHGPLERLTARQREVLQLIAEGHNTKEIAYLLKVSVKTVEAHRTQLTHRLGIFDIPGLVRCAMRSGLVPMEASPS
jgi:DNA-binding NarL/FixJ family response regulator